MPEIADDQKKEDAALLMGEEQKPVEEAKEPEVKEEPAAEAPEPKKEKPDWGPPLTKVQQELANQKRDNAEYKRLLAAQDAKINKLLAYNGIEVETPPAETVPPAAQDLPSEADMERAELRREVKFIKIRQDAPGFDPDKEWEESWKDALATYDIAEDADALPEGITRKALEKLADKNFQARLGKAKKAPPPSPPVRPKPKTPGPAAPPTRHASHVPSPSAGPRLSATEIMKRDAAFLMGEDAG